MLFISAPSFATVTLPKYTFGTISAVYLLLGLSDGGAVFSTITPLLPLPMPLLLVIPLPLLLVGVDVVVDEGAILPLFLV